MGETETLKGVILDDDYGRARIVRQIIEEHGHGEALIATAATTALDSLQRGGFTFAVINLPEGDENSQAVQFMARLRRPVESPAPGLAVLAVTGEATETALRRAVSIGADYVIKRPFSAKDLLDRVRRMVRNPAPHFASSDYVGPDRRRMPRLAYDGPQRREHDRTST